MAVNNKSERGSCGTGWLFAVAIIVALVASGVAATFRHFMSVKRRDIWCEPFVVWRSPLHLVRNGKILDV